MQPRTSDIRDELNLFFLATNKILLRKSHNWITCACRCQSTVMLCACDLINTQIYIIRDILKSYRDGDKTTIHVLKKKTPNKEQTLAITAQHRRFQAAILQKRVIVVPTTHRRWHVLARLTSSEIKHSQQT